MSPAALDIVLLEPHEAALRSLLHRENGAEASAYVLFGRADISAGPLVGPTSHQADLARGHPRRGR